MTEMDEEEYWQSLTYEQQTLAFLAVMKRLHKAAIEDKGSFRYTLYDVFGFDTDMYVPAYEIGFMNIMNKLTVDD